MSYSPSEWIPSQPTPFRLSGVFPSPWVRTAGVLSDANGMLRGAEENGSVRNCLPKSLDQYCE